MGKKGRQAKLTKKVSVMPYPDKLYMITSHRMPVNDSVDYRGIRYFPVRTFLLMLVIARSASRASGAINNSFIGEPSSPSVAAETRETKSK